MAKTKKKRKNGISTEARQELRKEKAELRSKQSRRGVYMMFGAIALLALALALLFAAFNMGG